jgi:UDP-N-acetylmuramoyl-tripeptide--D-alanyl-D-alanine ligase
VKWLDVLHHLSLRDFKFFDFSAHISINFYRLLLIMQTATIDKLYQCFQNSQGVSTDTRHIEEGMMFFALKGPNFNGNKFAKDALEKGAKYAVVDEAEYATDERFLLVEDVLKALQDMARHHRRQFDIPFLALTGSNGKTTTKELINLVLSKKYKTLATKGNLNNHIGVPLTLLRVDKSTEIAIIEMGANSVGEIAALCQIAEPNHGLITNIGKAHIEGFGGMEGIIRGKSELYDFLIKNEGTIFVNSRQEVLMNMAKRMKEPILYPGKGDFYHCLLLEADPYVVYRSENEQEVHTHLIGTYNFDNIATALCIGKFFDVDEKDANEAITDYVPSNMRSQIVRIGSNTIILDAYNANPTSMEAALQNLEQMDAMRKVAILGDMNELGMDSDEEHRKVGSLVDHLHIDEVYFCGQKIKAALKTHPTGIHVDNRNEMIQILEKKHFDNCVILIKGSRSVGLESVVDFINE